MHHHHHHHQLLDIAVFVTMSLMTEKQYDASWQSHQMYDWNSIHDLNFHH
jgi:hypothetical protein